MEDKDISEWWNIDAKRVFRFLVRNTAAAGAEEGNLNIHEAKQ